MNFLSINIRGMGSEVKADWVKNIRADEGISFIAMQETFKAEVGINEAAKYWDRSPFGMEFSGAIGRSGGLLCLWDSGRFSKTGAVKDQNFLLIQGIIKGCGSIINIINVYAPQRREEKRRLWDKIMDLKREFSGMWVMLGDFNSVRWQEERRNSRFDLQEASDFNSFIAEANLSEFAMKGKKFTRYSGNKMSKIDRVLVCQECVLKWPDAGFRALGNLHSDHCPIVLITNNVNFGPRPFRFFNSWLDRPDFDHMVRLSCAKFGGGGAPDVRLMQKLRHLRMDIKCWWNEVRAKEQEELSILSSEIDKFDEILEVRDLLEEELWARLEAKKRIVEIEGHKKQDLKQRARVKWATEGDDNTAYFHRAVNHRRLWNSIPGLEVNGVWVVSPKTIKKEIFQFFRNRFAEPYESRPALTCSNLKTVSEEDNRMLTEKFELEEIKEAVFGCGGDRAPGPDGFNFRFLKRYWDLFAQDFVNILQHFYDHGTINRGCASSFLALIPKVSDPSSLNDYRPINLIGVISKVISKILANRIRRMISSVISESQSAFLSERYILDGPLMVNEILTWAKKSSVDVFLLKIDFEKAYDNVNWNFVLSIMNQMGFSDRWCMWIRGILRSASSSVLVNASPTFEFKCHKGLRQGDPLSPFLFILVMEAFSGMVSKACDVGIIKGIQLPDGGPRISHLLYADDSIIIGEWAEDCIRNVVRLLRVFYVCSGLKINIHKSNLFGCGKRLEEVKAMASSIGCLHGSVPFKYLGLTVGANMNRIANWESVIKIFESRLATWKATALSIGGRSTLIRSVLASLPNYYFSLYKAPKKVIEILERCMKRFLWGGSSTAQKMHWVAWDTVTLPKEKGGLGIMRLGIMNKALLSKWGWRYKTERSNLWRKTIDAIHWKKKETKAFPVNVSFPGVWKNIVANVSMIPFGEVGFNDMCKGINGNGENISFWLDRWLGNKPLCEVFPNLFSIEKCRNCKISERIRWRDHLTEWSWNWSKQPNSEVERTEWERLIGLLVVARGNGGLDSWRWEGDPSGVFSVASVRRHMANRVGDSTRSVVNWSKWVPVKVNIFMWRAALNRIPTSAALRRRNIEIDTMACSLCGVDDETVDHLFSGCGVAGEVWRCLSSWCSIPEIFGFDFKDILEAHKFSPLSPGKKDVLHGLVMITCWRIWKARNEKRFSAKRVSAVEIFEDIRILGFLWFKNRSKYKNTTWEDWVSFKLM